MPNNPVVHSKGSRHGMPRTPGKVSNPGGSAPVAGAGTKASSDHGDRVYFAPSGHMVPRQVTSDTNIAPKTSQRLDYKLQKG